MNLNSPTSRAILGVIAVGLIVYGALPLLRGLLFGDWYARAAIAVQLVAWLAAYLLWGKKLAAWLRNPN